VRLKISPTILFFVPVVQQTGSDRSPSPAGPPAALAHRLGYLLKHAYLRYQAIQGPALAPVGLDGRLLAVLTLVDAEGPMLQQRLAERLQVDRTSMVGLVDVLEKGRLVERRRDAGDRRGQHVGITRKGKTVLVRAHEAVIGVEGEFLKRLSATERDQLRKLLDKVAVEAGQDD
jgi:DNA-binding MarR family transcriptional regulator